MRKLALLLVGSLAAFGLPLACSDSEEAGAAADDGGVDARRSTGDSAPPEAAAPKTCTALKVTGPFVAPMDPTSDAGALTDAGDAGDEAGADGGPAPTPPTPSGGTIVPGTYLIESIVNYGAVFGGGSSRATRRFDSSRFEVNAEELGGGVKYEIAGTYSLSGTSATFTPECTAGPDGDRIRSAPTTVGYSADDKRVSFHQKIGTGTFVITHVRTGD